MSTSTWLEDGRQLAEELVSFRRDLHLHPELSLQESETAAKTAAQLEKLGLRVRRNVGGHGIVAELIGDEPGPIIALRADMDALPIHEETDVPFASTKPGIMHACGHDAHTAILLGAAKLLRGRKLKGTVRFLFQAAEEINAGAKAMIQDGVLEDVAEIYGLHNLPTLSAGKAATRYGSLMGSVDRIDIKLEGKGAHGAIPNQGIDPIVCASAIVLALQSIASREASPFEPVVVTIGSIHAGEANNVIPQYAELTGTIRTFDAKVQEQMKERIERLINGVAESYRCKASIHYTEQTPVLINDDNCVRHTEQVIDDLIGCDNRIVAPPTLAGEDFSIYLQHVPGCFFWLGSGPATDAEQAFGLHHPKFYLHEACIPLGASLLAAIAAERLNGNAV